MKLLTFKNCIFPLVRWHTAAKKPLDEAKWRIEYNDRPNAEMILKSKENADLIINSVEIS
ncbi:Phosphomannomutase [Bienertia sinuspersici]